MTMNSAQSERVQALVVGAGPVGLFAALCAARRGLDVLVLDEAWRDYAPGHASLLHPGTLALLEEGGLAEKLRAKGRTVERIQIYIDGTAVKTVTLPAPALAVPQTTLEEVLLEAARHEGVELRAPHQAATIEQQDGYVDVRVIRRELLTASSPASSGEWEPVESSLVRADFVIGADGYHSRVRSALGIETAEVGSSETFTMFEFPLAAEPGAEEELCFSEELGSVMLPLPGQRARWAFQIDDGLDALPDIGRLRELLERRAPWAIGCTDRVNWGTVIQFERRLARRFGKRRVWLAGDAAHITSPLGGHSMNVGLSEARDLAQRIANSVDSSNGYSALERYGSEREREWHKLLGLNVRFDLLAHAPPWLAKYARRLMPALPASGAELAEILGALGLRLA